MKMLSCLNELEAAVNTLSNTFRLQLLLLVLVRLLSDS